MIAAETADKALNKAGVVAKVPGRGEAADEEWGAVVVVSAPVAIAHARTAERQFHISRASPVLT